MRIKKLEITEFGKFNNMMIDFNDGINVIHGANESGKSTIMSFIYAMLFDTEKGEGIYNVSSIYSRFRQWDSNNPPSGAMEFEHEGISYRIEKTFNKRNQVLRLINLDIGREVFPAGETLKKLLAGLNWMDYPSTYFYGENAARPGKSLGRSITKHALKNGDFGPHKIDTDYAVSLLENKKRDFLNDEDSRRIRELDEIILNEEKTEKELDRIAAMELCGMTEIEELSIRQEKLSRKSLYEENEKEYFKNRERYNAYKKDVEFQKQLSTQLEDAIIRRGEIEENSEKLVRCKEELSAVRNFIKRTHDLEIRLNQETEAILNSMRTDNRNGFSRQLTLAGFVFLLCFIGIVFLAEKRPVYAGVCFAGSIAGVVMFINMTLRLHAERRKTGSRLESLRDSMQDLENEKEIFTRTHSSEEELSQRLEVYLKEDGCGPEVLAKEKELAEEIKKLESELSVRHKELLTFFGKFGGVEDLKDDELNIQEVRLREEAEKKASELEKVKSKISGLRESVIKLHMQIEAGEENEEKLLKHRDERSKILERKASSEREAEAIGYAIDAINEISVRTHEGVGRAVNQKASEYAQAFTSNKYTSFLTDENLNCKVDYLNKYVEIEKLSNGTKCQLGLALRLAAGDIILKDYELPLVFDDAFVYYDDNRLAATLRKLGSGRYGQVIIFTCQSREETILSQLDLDCLCTELK